MGIVARQTVPVGKGLVVRPADLLLVSSDKALYSYARTRGAAVLRAHEWNALARGATPRVSKRPRAADSEKPERETDVLGWLERFSREYLVALMREFKGNVSKAAERAHVERETLHRLLRKHGVRGHDFREDD